MVRREGNRLLAEGAVTAETVPSLLGEGTAQRRNGVEVIDLAAVTEVDSAALALALAWPREARAAGRTIRLANLPPETENLARLYAVDELLTIGTPPGPGGVSVARRQASMMGRDMTIPAAGSR